MHSFRKNFTTKQALTTLLVATLLAASSAEADASPIAHNQSSINYEGRSYAMDYVTVDVKDPTIQVKAVAANHHIGDVQAFKDMMTDNSAVVGINGTFFNAFEEDTDIRIPYGVLYNQNELHYNGDKNIAITVSKDKLPEVQQIQVGSSLRVGSLSIQLNGIDREAEDAPRSAWVYTKDYGDAVAYPGVKIVVDKDNKVTSVSEGEGLITAGGKVVLLSADQVIANVMKLVKKDDKFTMNQTAGYADTKTSVPLEHVQMAIGAGPRLITNGVVDLDFVRDRFTDPLVIESSNVRSFAGTDWAGNLVVGTLSYCTIEQMAHVLSEAGFKDAINLDGGASSAFYLNGRTLRAPGRLLSNALIVQVLDKPQVQLEVNGQYVSGYQGFVENGVTLVPFRALLNRMNADYAWNTEASALTISKGKTTVVIRPDEPFATVNGQQLALEAPLKNVDGRLYVPLRFISEVLGAQIEWDESLYRANIHF
jgi:exopolysaccharide biosynthesis protein